MASTLSGDLVYVEILGQRVLVLNSAEAVNELFERRSAMYSSRAHIVMIAELSRFSPTVRGALAHGLCALSTEWEWNGCWPTFRTERDGASGDARCIPRCTQTAWINTNTSNSARLTRCCDGFSLIRITSRATFGSEHIFCGSK